MKSNFISSLSSQHFDDFKQLNSGVSSKSGFRTKFSTDYPKAIQPTSKS